VFFCFAFLKDFNFLLLSLSLIEGYLATMYKNNQKPNIKTYTLKDYRQFKKDSGIPSTTSTGKLGFDFDSLNYKEKVILNAYLY
jgi:hypothetical protein